MSVINTKFIVNEEDRNKRLDVFLSEKTGETRSQITKLIKKGGVLINDKAPKKVGEKLTSIKNVTIIPVEEDVISEKEEAEKDFDIRIVKEGDEYLVVEKPAGLLVHPTEAGEKNTLATWLLEKYPEIKGVGESDVRPGIVHRLDKEASGLLVVAKTQNMYEFLKKQFQKREVEKIYLVLVYGKFDEKHGIIDFDIDRGVSGKMVARPFVKEVTLQTVRNIQEGKKAKTEFWVEEEIGRFSLLKVKIYSGRTHQIRVHLFAYNHPVVGDNLYFNKKLVKDRDSIGRLFLHAHKLCFKDLSGKEVCFESGLPKELKDFLEKNR